MLTTAAYFQEDLAEEHEIRTVADELYRRADWQWATNRRATVTHGWRPESGFLPYRWQGYDEALLLYILGLAPPPTRCRRRATGPGCPRTPGGRCTSTSSSSPAPCSSTRSPTSGGLSRDPDAFMRDKGLDYFENSRRATYVQREYAIRNPLEFASYHEDCWGVTTSGRPRLGDAPDDGVERLFFAYRARRAPYGPDDGTLSPWAVLASLPFVPPEIVLSACRHFEDMDLGIDRPYGF
jgi:hypothetical protein